MSNQQKIVIFWSTKKTITLICAILLIPTFLVLLFSATLKTTVVNPDYYKANLKKIDAYNRIINEGIPSLILDSKISNNQTTDTLAKQFSIFIIQKSFDPIWVENATGKIIDQAVGFLTDSHRDVTLNLGDSQKYVKAVSNGLAIVEQMIPACGSSTNAVFDCSKIVGNPDTVKQNIETIRQKIVRLDLGVVNLSQSINQTSSFLQGIHRFSQNIQIYFWVSLIITILLLGIIIFMELKDLAFMFKTVSLALAISSLLVLLLGLAFATLVPVNLTGNVNLPQAMQEILNDFLYTSFIGIFHRLEIVAGIFLALFLGIYVTTIILEIQKVQFLKNRE